MSSIVLRKLSVLGGFVLFVVLIYVFYQTFVFARITGEKLGLSPVSIYQLATDGEALIKNTDGRVNILLLGVGGGTHDGPDLTDTIILVSFHMTKKNVTLISVPRDIWSDTLKDKVNTAYHYGEEKKQNGGLTLSSTIIEDILGVPVHYAMVIDFSQFEALIDYIGGIDIHVPVSFVDGDYPIAGKETDTCSGDPLYRCRYQTITFEQGLQHMDGKKALMYVRSRHAEGEEGNDFSRGRRQQDVIIAVKSKIVSLEPWYHPDVSVHLFQSFDKATTTNMSFGQLLALGKLSIGIQSEAIKKISIESYLSEAPIDVYQRYALVPKDSFDAIHGYIKTSLEGNIH